MMCVSKLYSLMPVYTLKFTNPPNIKMTPYSIAFRAQNCRYLRIGIPKASFEENQICYNETHQIPNNIKLNDAK